MGENWTETTSAAYRRLAQVAVPARAEQMAALLTLIPFAPDQPFRVVELASGEGRLASALLGAFPQATLLALDGSESMRAATAQRLAPFGERASVGSFDMAATGWLPLLDGADVVLSSLCVHHLSGPQKQFLFAAIAARLSDRGALLIADLVEPARGEARELFASTWDRTVELQSQALVGSDALARLFQQENWNHFRFPDPVDKPSPLFAQLQWLSAAGFAVVDCFWMQAGHAIYGGYKATPNDSRHGLPYTTALKAAEAALQD
ncbi:MAG: class I SAM-dependent methyltransferase [Chloroflexota bacterium]